MTPELPDVSLFPESAPDHIALVSIIMPAYNASATIAEAINSIRSQSEESWELFVIVDQNSDNETRHIVQQMSEADLRIRLIEGPSEGGCSANRNLGLRLATGKFIAFLDSDDKWLPEKLYVQTQFMEETGCDFSYTGYQQMSEDGELLSTVLEPPSELSYHDLLRDNQIGCLTVMIRRSRFPNLQFVDFLHEDYILWLFLLRQTTAKGLPRKLAYYRVANSSRSGNKLRAAKARWQILRKFEHLSILRCVPIFVEYGFRALSRRISSN